MHGFQKCGVLAGRTPSLLSSSRIGIGLEKLDRDLYDPRPLYAELAELGLKWVRIQSGWCRTEKTKGSYDFTWLDEIVDRLRERELTPWMCLCYGNELYTREACNAYGAVGRPPIGTEEEKEAWCRYVKACVSHYSGRVDHFEIWNEPDGTHCWRHGVNAAEYGAFAIMTARAIREVMPDAKIIAGAFFTEIAYIYDVLKTGLAPYIDYVSYHRYKYNPDHGNERFTRALRATLDLFSPAIGIIQGETGTHSRKSPNGALPGAAWDERRQAKFLLRKLVSDLAAGVAFTSYFTAADIYENIISDEGTKSEEYYGFFGVLGEEFDERGIPLGRYRRKVSFHALRALCSVMDGGEKPFDPAITFHAAFSSLIGGEDVNPFHDDEHVYLHGFRLSNGCRALAYWKGTDLLTCDFASTVSAKALGETGGVYLIDLLDGTVYLPDEEHARIEDGKMILSHIPIRDYPLLLVFGEPKELFA